MTETSLKPGGINVEISADKAKLSKGLIDARREVEGFRGALAATGLKLGADFSKNVAKGVAGAVAIQIGARVFETINAELDRQTAAGVADFAAFGERIGTAIAEGVGRIPILADVVKGVGELGKFFAYGFDQAFFGGVRADETRNAAIRPAADQLSLAYGKIGDAIRALSAPEMSQTAKLLAEFRQQYLDLAATLKESKLELRAKGIGGTGDIDEEVRDDPRLREFLLKSQSRVQSALGDRFRAALETADDLSGAVDLVERRRAMLEEMISAIEDEMRSVGLAPFASDVGSTIRERYQWGLAEAARRQREDEERSRQSDLERQRERFVGDLEQAAARAGKSGIELLRDELAAMGADAAQTARAIAAFNEAGAIKATGEILSIVEDLERQAASIGKSGLEVLRDRLLEMGAGTDFVERALRARAAIDVDAIGPLSPKTYDNFSTFLASRLDQQFANEPARKLDDRVAKIQRDLERMLQEIRDPNRGLLFGA